MRRRRRRTYFIANEVGNAISDSEKVFVKYSDFTDGQQVKEVVEILVREGRLPVRADVYRGVVTFHNERYE